MTGDFTMGSFHVGPLYPGLPIFTDAYLVGLRWRVRPPPGTKRFFGSVDIGAIPLDPPNYTIGITGTVVDHLPRDGTGDRGGGRLGFGARPADCHREDDLPDQRLLRGRRQPRLDLDVAAYESSLKAFVDLPGHAFSAELTGDLSVGGYTVASADGIISSKGVGACGKYLVLEVGFTYPWGGSPTPMLESCDFSSLRVQPVSAAAASATAHAAVATVPVAAGSAVTDISVNGAGGVPSVVLTDPQGHTVVPQVLSPSTVHAAALAAAFPKADTNVIALRSPRAGTWRVGTAPGSVAITSVASARGYPAPTLKAHVTGSGHRRSLHYAVTRRPGLSVAFAEQGGRVFRMIGTARGSKGTLRFAPAVGAAGRRSIYAIVTESGVPRERVKVAGYTAPAPARPGRVKGLRVAGRGRSFRVSFGSAVNAAHYIVRVTGAMAAI